MIQQTITGTAVRRAGAWSTGLAPLDAILNGSRQMFTWPSRITLSVTRGEVMFQLEQRIRVVKPAEPDMYIPPLQYFTLDAPDGAECFFSWIPS